jgi:hypothetical protein
MGAIQDHTRGHLGQSDKAISAYRRILRVAIDEGGNQGADGARSRLRREDDRTGGESTASARPTAGRVAGSRTDATRRKASNWANGGELSAC